MSKVIEDKVQKIREIELQKKSFKKIFRGRNGKLAMTMLESLCYYNTSTYVKGDPQGTALNEGVRNTLLKIKDFISTPDSEFERRSEAKIKTLRHERRTNDGISSSYTVFTD
jgi:hypothetical protein